MWHQWRHAMVTSMSTGRKWPEMHVCVVRCHFSIWHYIVLHYTTDGTTHFSSIILYFLFWWSCCCAIKIKSNHLFSNMSCRRIRVRCNSTRIEGRIHSQILPTCSARRSKNRYIYRNANQCETLLSKNKVKIWRKTERKEKGGWRGRDGREMIYRRQQQRDERCTVRLNHPQSQQTPRGGLQRGEAIGDGPRDHRDEQQSSGCLM